MAYWKKCFGKVSDLLTSNRFLVAWSVFYVTFLFLKNIWRFREEFLASDYNFADFFINYSGGFVRRGLLGQIFLWCHQIGISPIWTAATLALLAFLAIAIYMIRQFKKRSYNICLLTVGWFLGAFGLYGIGFMRRDYLIMCFFLLVVWLWRRMAVVKWVLLANVLVCLFILCYEPFALFAIPFCILLTRLRVENWYRSFACWILPMITFLVCCKYAGGKEVYDAIVASTSDFLSSPGIMTFLQNGSADTMCFHMRVNFLQIQYGIPNCLLSFISLVIIVFYSVNAVPVFSQNKCDFINRRYILSFLISSFVFLSPMFTFLSTDYSRTCVYVCLSSYMLYFFLDDKERAMLLPSFVYSWADKLLKISDKHLRPTRFKIVFIMLFLGISGWTGGGIKGLISGSEVGNVAYIVWYVLKKYAFVLING